MSQNLEVAVHLKASAEQFASAINQANSQFQAAMSGMDQTAKQTGSSVEQAMEKIGIRRHSDINAEIKSVEDAYRQLAESGELTERELAQAALKKEQHVGRLRAETSSWKESLGAMKGELIAAGAAIYGLQRALGSVGREASQFSTAMAEVSTLLDDTSAVDGLSQSVREMAKEFGGNAADQAKALYQIISAGASDAAEATRLLDAANRLAIGGVTDVKTAADGLTSIINAYGKATDEAGQVSDFMFTAMRAGKTTIEELSNGIGSVAPLASQAGAGIEELLAATAALTKGGVGTNEAMTQLRGILAAVVKPTKEAADLAEELGLQFDTAAIRSKGLAGFLEEVADKTGGSEAAISRLFGRVEALNGVFALTGNAAEGFSEILADMGDSAGATGVAFEKMADTPEMAMRRFESAMGDLKITLGQTVTAMAPVLEMLTGAVNAFNDLPGPVRNTAGAIAIAAAGVPVLVMALGSLVKALGILRTAFAIQGVLGAFTGGLTAATAATGAATAATKLLAAAMKTVPFVLIAATAASAASALWGWHRATSAAREATEGLEGQAERLAGRIAELAEETGLTITSMDHFHALVERGAIALDDATGKWISAAQAQARLAEEADRAAEAQAGLNQEVDRSHISDEAKRVVDLGFAIRDWREQIEKIDPAAQGAEGAIKELIESAAIGETLEMAGLIRAIERVGEEAPEVAALVERELIGAIKKLDSENLQNLSNALKTAFDQGLISAEQFATAAEATVASAAQRMGIDIETALGRTTQATRRSLDDIRTMAGGLEALGATSQGQSEIIQQALQRAFSNAKTKADVEALQAEVQALGEAGKLTAESVKELGVVGDQAMSQFADSTNTATDAAQALQERWQALGETIKTTNREIAQTAQVTETVADATEKAKEGAGSLSIAIDTVAISAKRARVELSELEGSAGVVSRAWQEAYQSVMTSWKGMGTYSYLANFRRAMIAAQEAGERAARAIVELNRAIAAIETESSSAAQGVRDLEFRLLELTATEEEIAKARAEREKASIDLQMQRNRLEAERARLAGDTAKADQLDQENRFLADQIRLLGQISQIEQQQRRERERAAAEPEPQRPTPQPQPQPARPQSSGTLRIEIGDVSADIPERSKDDVLRLIEEAIRRSR